MSWPDTPALRMRDAAAASPPNPPPTMCAFIPRLPGPRVWEVLPTRAHSSAERIVSITKRQTASRRRLPADLALDQGFFRYRPELHPLIDQSLSECTFGAEPA